MKRYKIVVLVSMMTSLILTSCVDDLNTVPLNKTVTTTADVYKNPDSYKEFLAKLYGSLTLTGQQGQAGKPEISNPDEGQTSFMRMYWTAQEITTDECMGVWPDSPIIEYNGTSYTSQNPYIRLMYMRIFINIAYCNEYIREVSVHDADVPENMKADVKTYIAEARFLRSLFYFYAMDLWGNVPFVTDKDEVGAFLPKQIKRADLFTYVESELLDILPTLVESGKNEYARADQSAAWMLLAKLYLNAKVYTGTERNTDCVTYCNKIINSPAGYTLNGSYDELFMADNHRLTKEIIFPIAEDGMRTQNYGGMNFIIHAQIGTSESGPAFGIDGGWGGNRFRKAFVEKFDDISGKTDTRAHFNTDGHTLEIDQFSTYLQGYGCTKFTNVTSTGAAGQNPKFVDTDFPLFRLADVYLMYAEAVLRGGTGGDKTTATAYVNKIISRAYGNNSENINESDLDLQFVLDERARELYWEAQRRTDLIRFDQFTGGTYVWDWKGNVKAGITTDAHYNVFPLPASDLFINTNLVQNKDY